MKRGEIWWAELPQPAGRRPVVLLSRNEAYLVRESITVAEVTTRVRGIRSEVPVGSREGLPRRSVVNADNVQTLSKRRLVERAGSVGAAAMDALDRAVAYSLGLDALLARADGAP